MDAMQPPRILMGQLARYGLVGLSLNAGLYGVYLCLTALGLWPALAATAVFLMGIPLSLMAHGRLTFRVPGVDRVRQLYFAGGYLVGYVVQIGLLLGLYRGLGLPHQLSQLCAMAGVALVLFFYQRRVVFGR